MSIEADVPATAHDPDFLNSTLPSWKSHKVVKAIKIARIDVVDNSPVKRLLVPEMEGHAPIEVDSIFVKMSKLEEGWYYVVYNDGYKSASPAKAFEEGYVLIDATPPNPQPWPEHALRKIELIVLAYRYGYAIDVSLISDQAYDRVLAQARTTNLPADASIRQPMNKDPKSYNAAVRAHYETLVVGTLQAHGMLGKLNEPSAAEFSIPYFIRQEAQAVFANTVVTDRDIESIIELAKETNPWFNELLPGDWLGLSGTRFSNLKNALSDATIAYITR